MQLVDEPKSDGVHFVPQYSKHVHNGQSKKEMGLPKTGIFTLSEMDVHVKRIFCQFPSFSSHTFLIAISLESSLQAQSIQRSILVYKAIQRSILRTIQKTVLLLHSEKR